MREAISASSGSSPWKILKEIDGVLEGLLHMQANTQRGATGYKGFSQLFWNEWRGRRDSNPRPLP